MDILKSFKIQKLAKKSFPAHKDLLCRVMDNYSNPFNSVPWNIVISFKGFDEVMVHIHYEYVSVKLAHSCDSRMPLKFDLDPKLWIELYSILEVIEEK